MNQEEFYDELKKLRQRYERTASIKDKLESIELNIKVILQDYLWENNFGARKLNAKTYRQLSMAWHPDKLKNIQDDAATTEEIVFLKWYIKVSGRVDTPFQAVSFVKECYRPELHFRARDADRPKGAGQSTNEDEHFYFVSSAGKASGVLYSIFWPLFYLLEALERNIDNYSNESSRYYARKFYHYMSLLPIWVSVGVFIVVGHVDLNLLELIAADTWIGNILLNLIYGLLFLGVGIYVGIKMSDICPIPDSAKDDVVHYFLALMLTPAIYYFNQLRQGPKVGENKRDFYLKNLSFLALASLVALIELACYGFGFYYSATFFATMVMFPLTALVLVNLPLLMWQAYSQPRQSLEKVTEYFFTVFNRYYSLILQTGRYLLELVAKLIHKIGQLPIWKETQPKETKPQTENQAQNTQKQPAQPSANQNASVSAEQNQAPLPYWKAKIQKYLNKHTPLLVAQKISLKKERGALLNSLGIKEGHAFREKLDNAINEKSIPTDDKGFVIQADIKMISVLETLNLKAQILYLSEAKKKGSSANQVVAQYPNDLDYHCLVKKQKSKS